MKVECTSMLQLPDKDLTAIKQRIVDGMADYMLADEEENSPNPNCTYQQSDIDRCERVMDRYLKDLVARTPGDQAAILECLKATVLQLNSVNQKAGGQLIETSQREELCEFLLVAARKAGLTTNDDVTEPWREW